MNKPISSQQEKGALVVALELMSQLNQETQHLPAAVTFCNELAFHFKCSRVALAYLRDDLVETVAISHATKFDRRLQTVRDLEMTMQEAADQDCDVYWPCAPEVPMISREHERYARRSAAQALCSLPLRADDQVRGVVTLVREDRVFFPAEIDALRLIVDLAARRLLDLDRYGNQWWRPFAEQGRDWLSRIVGPRHTWIKATAFIGAILAILLFLIPFPYRVSGEATLKTDAVVNLPAPFDGFIQSIDVIPGDDVQASQLLAQLDPTELKLKEEQARATMQHYQSQAQMSDGENDVTQMHVYQSQADEADSELHETQYDLDHAQITSPFAGIVVDGDLKDKVGSPVKQGDILMKVTRLEDLYVEADIAEEDIQDVREGVSGQVRLASRPADVFPMKVIRVEPAAFAMSKGNVFRIRCQFQCPPASWWRPGMTGIVKVDSGHANLWFIFTHRAIDFLRLKFWF